MRNPHCLFYNCPEIVDSVDNPLVDNLLVDNRLAEELVAGIAEVGEGGYSILEEGEGDILIWLVMTLIDGRKTYPILGGGGGPCCAH